MCVCNMKEIWVSDICFIYENADFWRQAVKYIQNKKWFGLSVHEVTCSQEIIFLNKKRHYINIAFTYSLSCCYLSNASYLHATTKIHFCKLNTMTNVEFVGGRVKIFRKALRYTWFCLCTWAHAICCSILSICCSRWISRVAPIGSCAPEGGAVWRSFPSVECVTVPMNDGTNSKDCTHSMLCLYAIPAIWNKMYSPSA